jgi:Holliday junction resolvasome RuvABC endonuclease subunit
MITIPTKQIEKALGIKVNPFLRCLGVDTASRTGWCMVLTNPDSVQIDYGFIDIKSKDRYFLFNELIRIFSELVKNQDIIIIEDVFLKFNVNTHSFLARIGMIVYVLAQLNGIKEKRFMWATTARKNLGLKATAKKAIIQQDFTKKLKMQLEDEDIIDAIILALNGVCEQPKVL